MGDFDALKDTEPMVGDVYAFRGFTTSPTGALVGMTYLQPILPGENRARCPHNSDHEAPAVDCSCGFYAFDSTPNTWRPGQIDAVVKLSGRVIVCERGVRAEIMEVVALAGGSRFIADGMGIPWFEDQNHMIETFPITQITRPEPEPDEEDTVDINVPVFLPQPKPQSFKTGFKSGLGSFWKQMPNAKITLLNLLLIVGVVTIPTALLYHLAGIDNYLLLTPVLCYGISLQVRSTTVMTSIEILLLLVIGGVFCGITGLPEGRLLDGLAELLVIGAFYLGAVHIFNIAKLSMQNSSIAGRGVASPNVFITGGVGRSMAKARRNTELAPNPVKTNPSDTEGR